MNDCEHIKPLLMGLMDGELTPDQISDVNRHLNRCRACREELEDLRQACDPLRELSYREPGRDIEARLWKTPFSRFSRYAGLLMVLCGWLTLMVWLTVAIAADRTTELPVKLGLAGILIGALILFGNVLLHRLGTWRQDPYNEVER